MNSFLPHSSWMGEQDERATGLKKNSPFFFPILLSSFSLKKIEPYEEETMTSKL